MNPTHRPRQRFTAALAVVLVLALAACSQDYPNSTFHSHTEFNALIDALFDKLLWLGTAVFVLVEGVLVYVVFKYRRREGRAEPKHVHGNTTLEILWTVIPALILIFIAVPTVRTIFRTQAKAAPNSLQVEVIGHQWWWEFRYPEYGIATANELYLPVGRTVNFALTTQDVLHSFWMPQLGGKRDLISNHTNYLWFTPDSSMATKVNNGFCAEFCGASHANMRFRVFTVTPEQFESWAAHQKTPAAFGAEVPAETNQPGAPGVGSPVAVAPSSSSPAGPAVAPGAGAAPTTTSATAPALTQVAGYSFPQSEMPAFAVPTTPVPDGLTFAAGITGDAERGRQLWTTGQGGCVGCHAIAGTPFNMANIGPNLTHVGSRTTIAAGLYPNDERHLRLWIKNAKLMKPGVIMPTIGKGQYDPVLKAVMTAGLTDQQIADMAAYLLALK